MMPKKARIHIVITFFVLLSCTWIASAADTDQKDEIKFGYLAERMLLSSEKVILDETINRKINEIGNKIAKASDNPDLEYRFYVINSPIVNAYSVSGGGVYIPTGLLDVLESEDELAGVIAHEIGHITQGHGVKFYRSSKTKAAVGASLIRGLSEVIGGQLLAAGDVTPYTHPYSYDSYSTLSFMGASYASSAVIAPIINQWIKGYGKENENEADDLAILYTYKAGYDPNGFLKFLDRLRVMRDRLALNNKKYVSHLMNAEPGLEERMTRVKAVISEITK